MKRDILPTTLHVRRDAALAVGAALVFAAVTAAVAGGPLLDLDLTVRVWVEAHRPGWAEQVVGVLNRLGQGFWFMVVSFILAGWAGRVRLRRGADRRSAIQPLLYVFAATVLLVPTVLVLKVVTERGAPRSTLPPEQTVELFGPLPADEYAAGYPGGHAANSVVWYGVVLALVITLLRLYGRNDPPRAVRVAIRIAPPAIVFALPNVFSGEGEYTIPDSWIREGAPGRPRYARPTGHPVGLSMLHR